ncbi:hypothetical protein PRIPAC_72973 [Pristionchus pacificus]|uniref:Uncharacterized protein n=1 Tax=Pristionchus pacificus TaxID=54126 RepID=A0A2A6CAA9_PRIPA|nr:hypothetical protein PRIPAC_72973 [Pristionchus pacificus]|eukprot:PDM75155.1 hypothetical protein PRIPAC_40536 [Pristionchus pacificus]
MSKRELQMRNWEDPLREFRERRIELELPNLGNYFAIKRHDSVYIAFLREEFNTYLERFPAWVRANILRATVVVVVVVEVVVDPVTPVVEVVVARTEGRQLLQQY